METAIAEQIRSRLDGMPPQVQAAARFIIDHPSEVALLSMREQARIAGVPPATMTRLAKRLGFPGYQQLKEAYAEAIRGNVAWFSGRAETLLTRHEEIGPAGLVAEMARTIALAVEELGRPASNDALIRAADVLSGCRRIFSIGARATYPVAFLFAYTQSYFWDRAVLLDGPGGTATDQLQRAGPEDGLLAVSLAPYAASTQAAVQQASAAGLAIVAITDSEFSPVARPAKAVIRVKPRSPSFFDTISPALAASEMLVALIASRVGARVPDEVSRREQQLAAAGVFWMPSRGR
jgi:DNA-binding MurR/RpiR family transcriptional regulator